MSKSRPLAAALRWPLRLPYLAWLLVAAVAVAAVFLWVDLAPQVGSDFFFATDDPQLARSLAIERLFPSDPQVLIHAAAADAASFQESAYREAIRDLTEALAAVPGVSGVYSLTAGPSSSVPQQVATSPLWGRLLINEDGRSSNLILYLEGEGSSAAVAAVDEVAVTHGDSLTLRLSGVPYVVEQIRRSLVRDLRVFSLSALLLFGLAVALVFRSAWVVLGTLTSCLTACALTLLILAWQGVPIGLLTANIATIVFVLTLSHIVFLTAAWRRWPGEGSVAGAVAQTLPASFWCAVTTLLGFTFLLFANARPLRELGNAGIVGTLVALGVAYLSYPPFLTRAPRSKSVPATAGPPRWSRPMGAAVLTALVVVLLMAFGLPRLNTDPNLLAYFKAGGELRQGLETIDTAGGSSPLSLVVQRPEGGTLLESATLQKLETLQGSLEADPATGMVLSLPVLLAEGKASPLGRYLPPPALVTLMESDALGGIARSFITENREVAHFLLRMRESGRKESRQAVVARLAGHVREAGLEPTLVGGLYDLQGQLARLVSGSLLKGLLALLGLFAFIAFTVARQPRTALAMLAVLVAVPVVILGLLGHLGWPLDVIASPAVNVALALGIDSMIHLVAARRRLASELPAGSGDWDSWIAARQQLASPILGAAAILSAGFGIFALSSFPPTRNFGLAVVAGTATAAFLALVVLPYLAGRRAC